jgi:putative sigma-54 modulation protein
MDIVIRSVGLELTKAQETAIEEKIGRVGDHGARIVRARVFVRKNSAHTSDRQFSIRVVCEIRGADIIAEQEGGDVLSAIDLVSEKVERQLRKRKTDRLARREVAATD